MTQEVILFELSIAILTPDLNYHLTLAQTLVSGMNNLP